MPKRHRQSLATISPVNPTEDLREDFETSIRQDTPLDLTQQHIQISVRDRNTEEIIDNISGGSSISGSDGNTGNISILSDIARQLSNLGSFEIQSFSQTRQETELLVVTFVEEGQVIPNISVNFGRDEIDYTVPSSTCALVESESGRRYIVDYAEQGTRRNPDNPDERIDLDYVGTCTCPDHHGRRHAQCRHLLAVQQALGIANAQLNIPVQHTGEINNTNNEIAEVNEGTSQAAPISREMLDDNSFYSDMSDEEFEQMMEAAKTEPMTYETVNALNGFDGTFGVELEFISPSPSAVNAIAKELYNLGLCSHSTIQSYHAETVEGMWIIERDGSLGYGGGELVSPILKDTPETWENIRKICEVVQRHGGYVNNQTGGHVHVGYNNLGQNKANWEKLITNVSAHEEIYMRAAGGELGEMRPSHYAKSIRLKRDRNASRGRTLRDRLRNLSETIMNSEAIRRFGDDRHGERYYTLNTENLGNGKPTIEFRAFNGTITPEVIQNNIRIATSFIRGSAYESLENPSEATSRRIEMLNSSVLSEKIAVQRSPKNIKKYLDTFFPRESDRKNVLRLISQNRWTNIFNGQ